MPAEERHVLDIARETESNAQDLLLFFDSAGKHLGPRAEEDWRRDLAPGELAGLVPQLRRTISWLSGAIGQILAENQADPDKAKLVIDGLRQIEQGGERIRAAETMLFGAGGGRPAARAQQDLAAENFPLSSASGRQSSSGSEDASRRRADSTTRRQPGASPGSTGGTAGPSRHGRPWGHR
jgi:hypothetical protein